MLPAHSITLHLFSGFGHLRVRLPSRLLQHVQVGPHHEEDFPLHHRFLAADVDNSMEQHCTVENGQVLFLLLAGLKVSKETSEGDQVRLSMSWMLFNQIDHAACRFHC